MPRSPLLAQLCKRSFAINPRTDVPGVFYGLIDAGLGRKEEAAYEGRRACELVPMSKDAIVGLDLITTLATIYPLDRRE